MRLSLVSSLSYMNHVHDRSHLFIIYRWATMRFAENLCILFISIFHYNTIYCGRTHTHAHVRTRTHTLRTSCCAAIIYQDYVLCSLLQWVMTSQLGVPGSRAGLIGSRRGCSLTLTKCTVPCMLCKRSLRRLLRICETSDGDCSSRHIESMIRTRTLQHPHN